MDTVILQVPMAKTIRDEAAQTASSLGFSSVQEIVRLFLNQLISKKIVVSFVPQINLSPANDRRYAKMVKEVKSGKVKTQAFSDADSLVEYLNS